MREGQIQLYAELQTFVDQGIMLFLDGRQSTPEYVTHILYAGENNCYMRDYVYDVRKGGLRELHFDKLKET
jgi:hypothetical protein